MGRPLQKGDRVRLNGKYKLSRSGRKSNRGEVGTVVREPRGAIIGVRWDGIKYVDYYSKNFLKRA